MVLWLWALMNAMGKDLLLLLFGFFGGGFVLELFVFDRLVIVFG